MTRPPSNSSGRAPARIAACLARPAQGPRLLFFSGGSALRETSRVLKRYTHNSIHLITPFDSGGSSAVLRDALGILGVGDVRNRMLALADETAEGNPQVAALFAYRLGGAEPTEAPRAELERMIAGEHPLVRAIGEPLRGVVLSHLASIARLGSEFLALRDACVGNLVLAGGYLACDGDLDAVLRLFSDLVHVRGQVRPTALANAHLVALHEGGARTVGQHLIGKPVTIARGRIDDLELTTALEGGERIEVDADAASLQLLAGADLVCFPMGSFFCSVLANLLPRGMGRAVLASRAPRVYVPNAGEDPEMHGHSLASCVRLIAEFIARDAGRPVEPREVLDYVLIDSAGVRYETELDLEALATLGVGILDSDLAATDRETIDPTKLVELLVGVRSQDKKPQ